MRNVALAAPLLGNWGAATAGGTLVTCLRIVECVSDNADRNDHERDGSINETTLHILGFLVFEAETKRG